MFATLAGGYPRVSATDDEVRAVLADQLEAGLELLTDGHARWDDPISGVAGAIDGMEIGESMPYLQSGTTYRQPRAVREPRWVRPITVEHWSFAAGCTEQAVKQVIVGPYTLARLSDPGQLGRERLTMALADVLGRELLALAEAGCPVIQVDEDAASLIDSNAEQQLFKAAHRRLTNRLDGPHLSLAITGGSAHRLQPRTLFDAQYQSFLFDVVAWPRNWELIAEAPTGRGIICGVVDARDPGLDDPDFLRWAARYAASMRGRGAQRVGLAPSSSLAGLSRDQARAKIEILGAIAQELAAEAHDGTGPALDPVRLVREGMDHGYFGRPPGT